jgi:hypothetical protein
LRVLAVPATLPKVFDYFKDYSSLKPSYKKAERRGAGPTTESPCAAPG